MQVLEMSPGPAHLGTTFQEASELKEQHEEVTEGIRSKQSPVEDLLEQADNLIANQKPKAEVGKELESLSFRAVNERLCFSIY